MLTFAVSHLAPARWEGLSEARFQMHRSKQPDRGDGCLTTAPRAEDLGSHSFAGCMTRNKFLNHFKGFGLSHCKIKTTPLL